ncbi:hypothetical protein NKG05_02150 [Oerskovia sp. M15]
MTNHGDTALDLGVYAADAFTSANGALDVLPAGTESEDLGTWIDLETRGSRSPGRAVDRPLHPDGPRGRHARRPHGRCGHVPRHGRRRGWGRGRPTTGHARPGPGRGRPRPVRDDLGRPRRLHGDVEPGGRGDARVTFTVANTGNVRLAGQIAATVSGPDDIGAVSVPSATCPSSCRATRSPSPGSRAESHRSDGSRHRSPSRPSSPRRRAPPCPTTQPPTPWIPPRARRTSGPSVVGARRGDPCGGRGARAADAPASGTRTVRGRGEGRGRGCLTPSSSSA